MGAYSRYGGYSAVTLPPKGILAGKGVYANDWDMMKHEFGHILQYREYGAEAYYKVIAPESLNSCTFHPYEHYKYWTETYANYLSYNYFYNKSLLNWAGLGNMPSLKWNIYGYPIENISNENLIKLLWNGK